MILIAGRDCDNCIYCSIIEETRSRIFVECDVRGKRYYYGQCVPCEDKREIIKDE